MRIFSFWLAGLLLAACSGSRSEGSNGLDDESQGSLDGGSNRDGGMDGGDGDGEGDPDAGEKDDGGDPTNSLDAGVGFAVTVRADGEPLGGSRVVLHDADGEPIADLTTDSDGVAASELAPSSMSLFVGLFPGPLPILLAQPITYFGLSAGDRIEIDLVRSSASQVGSYDVSFAGDQGFDGANGYDLFAGSESCAGYTEDPTTAAEVDLSDRCAHAQNAVLSVAYDFNSLPFAYAYAKNVAAPSSAAPVEVTLGAFASAGSTTVVAENVAGDPSDSFASLRMVANGGLFWGGDGSDSTLEEGVVFPTATGFADALEVGGVIYEEGEGQVELGFLQRVAPQATVTLDFDTALPRVTEGAFDTSTQTVSWVAESALDGADVGMAVLGWTELNGEDLVFVARALIVPPDVTSVKLPKYPDDLESAGAIPGDADLRRVVFVDDDSLDGFSEFKGRPLKPRDEESWTGGGFEFSLSGVSGRIRLTAFSSL